MSRFKLRILATSYRWFMSEIDTFLRTIRHLNRTSGAVNLTKDLVETLARSVVDGKWDRTYAHYLLRCIAWRCPVNRHKSGDQSGMEIQDGASCKVVHHPPHYMAVFICRYARQKLSDDLFSIHVYTLHNEATVYSTSLKRARL